MKLKVILTLFLSSCIGINFAFSLNVTAKFKVDVNQNDTSITIQNQSTAKAKLYRIDFGDGTIIFSQVKQNYDHRYSAIGVYSICLSVYDTVKDLPLADTTCTTIEFVATTSSCFADFDVLVTSVSVNCTDKSLGTYNKVLWDYGDGSQSSKKGSVDHTYKTSGFYDVKLTILGKKANCESEKIKNIAIIKDSSDYVAYFTYSIQNKTTVKFFNQTVGANFKFSWQFGNGSSSNDTSPVCTYKKPGIYKVRLTVQDKDAKSKSEFDQTITIDAQNIDNLPDFDVFTDTSSDTVIFSNTSLGNNVKSYIWSLGDGNVSKDSVPSYVYSLPGDYSVCLSVVPKSGRNFNTICRNITVGTTRSLIPDFSYVLLSDSIVSFISLIDVTPDSVMWDFGDGETSLDSLPVHVYKKAGIYLVSLKIKYNQKVYEKIQVINLTSEPNKLICRFKFGSNVENHLKSGGAKIRFKGSLSGDISRLRFVWVFGDGATDSLALETDHIYTNDGVFYPCFKVLNYLTGDSDISCDTLRIASIADVPDNHFNVNDISFFPNPATNGITLRMNSIKNTKASINFFDISGRQLKQILHVNLVVGINELNIPLNLSEGVYLLKVNIDNEAYSRKLLIK